MYTSLTEPKHPYNDKFRLCKVKIDENKKEKKKTTTKYCSVFVCCGELIKLSIHIYFQFISLLRTFFHCNRGHTLLNVVRVTKTEIERNT